MAIGFLAAITNNPMLAWFFGVTGGVATGSTLDSSSNSVEGE